MLEPGTSVGRYVVRRKLAEGGMADIYLASAVGAEGFAKDVVIKVVRPFLSTDPQFVQMFIAEARLASRLNHANIVQIFDFGRHEERYFLAMEYVRGASLWDLRKRCQELGVPFPPTLAAEICAQVARGLQYAHTLSEGGRQLGVVHRDVTPHNVLLSYDGVVKLTDFGIAKASTSRTAPGMLKGKFAYMSPEQSRGEPVDARTDVFALGIVLWEMLTGGRLFDGDSDLAVLRAVQGSLIAPPSRLNPDVPQELSDVVMKALSRRVEERFQSASEVERALATYVLRNAETVEDHSVSLFLQEMFREEYAFHPEDSYGTGDTSFLDRLKGASGTMTNTPVGPVHAHATPPPPRKRAQVAEGTIEQPVVAVSATDDSGENGRGSSGRAWPRRTEPMPGPMVVGNDQMLAHRPGSSVARRLGRFPSPEVSVLVRSKADRTSSKSSENPARDEALPALPPRRRPLALLVSAGLAAVAIAGGAVALEMWPREATSGLVEAPPKRVHADADQRGPTAAVPVPSEPTPPPADLPVAASVVDHATEDLAKAPLAPAPKADPKTKARVVITNEQIATRLSRIDALLTSKEAATRQEDIVLRQFVAQARKQVKTGLDDSGRRELWDALSDIEAQLRR